MRFAIIQRTVCTSSTYITDDTGMIGTSHDHVPTSMITNDGERVRIDSQVQLDMVSIPVYRPR